MMKSKMWTLAMAFAAAFASPMADDSFDDDFTENEVLGETNPKATKNILHAMDKAEPGQFVRNSPESAST